MDWCTLEKTINIMPHKSRITYNTVQLFNNLKIWEYSESTVVEKGEHEDLWNRIPCEVGIIFSTDDSQMPSVRLFFKWWDLGKF